MYFHRKNLIKISIFMADVHFLIFFFFCGGKIIDYINTYFSVKLKLLNA